MLEARSVALVGASARPGSLGARMIAELAKSPSRPRTYLVNPRYADIGSVPCHPSLDDLPEPVDLALLAVPDAALEEQLSAAARTKARSAVIFGNVFDPPGRPGLRARLAATARQAGLAVCGAGCMGFVNVARGLRAVGYVEPDPLPAGPVALVTHSGSVFSALLRARRGFGFSLAVSSGQELITTAADYARYALQLSETRVLALVLEAIRDAAGLRSVLGAALAADVPVVLLSVGISAAGTALVSAHSGALAAADGAWQALARAYGVHRVCDLAELADTLELFSAGRSWAGGSWAGGSWAGRGSAGREPGHRQAGPGEAGPGEPGQGEAGQGEPGRREPGRREPGRRWGSRPGADRQAAAGTGIATVHDSGLERAHVADLAAEAGLPFAALGEATRTRLAAVLDPGLAPGNPLDVWGTGRDTEALFAECLSALAADPAVAAVALAVDLVPEFDGDESYPKAVLTAAARTAKPIAVLTGLPAAVDPAAAARLRAAGVPVLEGTRSGLLALRHLLDAAHFRADPPSPPSPPSAPAAAARWRQALARAARLAAEPARAARLAAEPARAAPQAAEPARAAPQAAEPARAAPQATEPARAAPLAAPALFAPPATLTPPNALAPLAPLGGAALFGLLRDYGIPTVRARQVATRAAALTAAAEIGYPIVLKTDEPGIAHKSDVGGVRLGLADPAATAAAYDDLAARLGPRVLVCETAASGTELALGVVRDPALGPLLVISAGGLLIEIFSERAVVLAPVTRSSALQIVRGLRLAPVLAGARGQPAADLDAIAEAISGLSRLACDLGDMLDALDINPLICGPAGAVAADALLIARTPDPRQPS